MWILLLDIFMAGPMGPDAKRFGIGVAIFLAGWGLVRAGAKKYRKTRNEKRKTR
jgi:hypothetical protein